MLNLHLRDYEIHDLSQLKHLLKLHELHIDCTHLKDLSELAEFKYCRRLGLQNVQPHHDLSFLKTMPQLYKLTLYEAGLDTESLTGIPVRNLDVPKGFPITQEFIDANPELEEIHIDGEEFDRYDFGN